MIDYKICLTCDKYFLAINNNLTHCDDCVKEQSKKTKTLYCLFCNIRYNKTHNNKHINNNKHKKNVYNYYNKCVVLN